MTLTLPHGRPRERAGQAEPEQTEHNRAAAITAAVDRAVFGRSEVWCEECGRDLEAHRAVWRGHHSYCCAEHEAADLY